MQNTSQTINKSEVQMPTVVFTQEAINQISLMIRHDLRIQEKVLRISINGKGCDGFNYAIGFDESNSNDLVQTFTELSFDGTNCQFRLALDPFAAYYLSDAQINYVFNIENNDEGFVIKNLNQKKFAGKFWKKDKSLVAPLESLKEKVLKPQSFGE